MKLIDKKDILFMDGMLIDPDNQVIWMPDLQDEINEIADLAELISFVGANDLEIKAAVDGKPIKFTPAKKEAPRIVTGKTVPTPLNDEFNEKAQARAEEWLSAQQFSDVDAHLGRYSSIAKFLAKDYVLVSGQEYSHAAFKIDPLGLTEAFVIATVQAYHDPAVRKLINGVQIGR
jgi:hypothetical protein